MLATQTHELEIVYDPIAQGHYGMCSVCYDVDENDGRMVATGAYFSHDKEDVKDMFWNEHVRKFPGDVLKGA